MTPGGGGGMTKFKSESVLSLITATPLPFIQVTPYPVISRILRSFVLFILRFRVVQKIVSIKGGEGI